MILADPGEPTVAEFKSVIKRTLQECGALDRARGLIRVRAAFGRCSVMYGPRWVIESTALFAHAGGTLQGDSR